jgi:hypothetical protein
MAKTRRKGAGRKPLSADQLRLRGAKAGRIQKARRRERATVTQLTPQTVAPTAETPALDVGALRKIPAQQIAGLQLELSRARGPKRLQVDRSLRGWFTIAHRCGLLSDAPTPPPRVHSEVDGLPQSLDDAAFDAEFDDQFDDRGDE